MKNYVMSFSMKESLGNTTVKIRSQPVVALSENENLEEYFKACGLMRCDPM